MGPVKCEIILDKSSKIYCAGETVIGTVAITLKTSATISVMNLHLIGKAIFGLFGQDTFEFFHETKSVEIKKILPSGTHEFPIQWTLPLDLISSFTWKSGSISYSFLTEVKYPSTSLLVEVLSLRVSASRTSVEIHNALNLNDLPLELQRARGYNASYFNDAAREEDGPATIAFDFVLERQCCVPGEFMKFTCSIDYENHDDRARKFPGVKVALDQVDTYKYNGTRTTAITKIWLKTGPKILPNDTTIWSDQIKIPNYCQSTPNDSVGTLSIQYVLNVTASFWTTMEKPQFQIPIIIGIIPLESTNQNNPPRMRHFERPTITLLNGSDELVLEDFEVEDEDYSEFSESMAPPPSYEEAVLLPTAVSVPSDIEMGPPPYTAAMNFNLETLQPFV